MLHQRSSVERTAKSKTLQNPSIERSSQSIRDTAFFICHRKFVELEIGVFRIACSSLVTNASDRIKISTTECSGIVFEGHSRCKIRYPGPDPLTVTREGTERVGIVGTGSTFIHCEPHRFGLLEEDIRKFTTSPS